MKILHALPDTAQKKNVHALRLWYPLVSWARFSSVGLVPRLVSRPPVKPSFSHGAALFAQFRLCLLQPTAPCIFNLLCPNEHPYKLYSGSLLWGGFFFS